MTEHEAHGQVFRSLAENLPDVVARFDRDLRHLYVNARIEEVTGMPREAFLGKTNGEVGMPAEMVERWEEALRRVFETGEAREIEFPFAAPGGTRYYESRLIPEFAPDGSVATVLGINRDVTEIRGTHHKLQLSEERYALAQRAAGIGSWDWNVLTGELHWSEQIEPMFGFEPGQFGATYDAFLACVHPDDREHVVDAVNACVRDGVEYDIEHRIVWPDGSVRWVSETGTAFRDEVGKATRMVGLVQDITRRRGLEDALRLNEERLNALLMLSQQASEMTEAEIVQFGLEEAVLLTGSRVGYIHVVNPADRSLRLVAWSREVLARCDGSFATHYPLDQAGVWADCVRLGKAVVHNDYPNLADRRGLPEGHSPLHRHLSVPVFDGGQVVAILGVGNKKAPYTDSDVLQARLVADGIWQIVERRRMEQALERSREDLQHFAHTVSHDLQEPLRTARGFLDLLVRRCEATLDAEAQEYIAFAVDGAARMERMIKALLDYSRITTRGRPLEPTDAGHVLEEALRDLRLSIEEMRATVTCDPLPVVMADEVQLRRVLQNLIGNALKFRRDEPPVVHVSAERDGDAWRFAVRDNGIGIGPAYQERIFEVFYRLHPEGQFEGTGIGLANCKKIVERHGGRIWVESTPGEGSTFYFTMPRVAEGSIG